MSSLINDGGRFRLPPRPLALLVACAVLLPACGAIDTLVGDDAASEPDEATTTSAAPETTTSAAPESTTSEPAATESTTSEPTGAFAGSYDRDETIDALIAEAGVTPEVAACIVDGMEDEIGPERLGERGDPTPDEEQIIVEITTDCLLADFDS